MKRINVNFEELRAVYYLATESGFRPASEQLGVSPSALSRTIARIEQRLDVQLFDRDTRKVALTGHGEVFLRLAKSMLGNAQNSMDEFQEYLEMKTGRLSIAGLPSVTAGLLPQLIAKFSRLHPELELKIIDALSDDVLSSVENGDADIGFTSNPYVETKHIAFKPLLDDRFVAIAAPGGPLDEDRQYRWSELSTLPFIAMAKGTSVRTLTDATFTQLNTEFRPRFEVSHLATAGALVAQMLGVTALPLFTLPVLGSKDLITRTLITPSVKRPIGLIWRANRTLSPAAAAFLKLVQEEISAENYMSEY